MCISISAYVICHTYMLVYAPAYDTCLSIYETTSGSPGIRPFGPMLNWDEAKNIPGAARRAETRPTLIKPSPAPSLRGLLNPKP